MVLIILISPHKHDKIKECEHHSSSVGALLMSLASSRYGHHGCLLSCHLTWSYLKFKQSMHDAIHIDMSPHKINGDHICH
jgi:hypothetical protein